MAFLTLTFLCSPPSKSILINYIYIYNVVNMNMWKNSSKSQLAFYHLACPRLLSSLNIQVSILLLPLSQVPPEMAPDPTWLPSCSSKACSPLSWPSPPAPGGGLGQSRAPQIALNAGVKATGLNPVCLYLASVMPQLTSDGGMSSASLKP